MHLFCVLSLWLCVLFIWLVSSVALAEGPRVESRRGMVVSAQAESSDVGAAVLREGGSAVDAAVATALALAVTFPEAGNIGGGGFMMVWPGAGRDPTCIEYRETAPAACMAETFVRDTLQTGHRVVGVPGTVRGLELAHRKFGRRPWKSLVMPAVRLADEGFTVNAQLASALNGLLKSSTDFAELRKVYAPPRAEGWRAGDRLRQPDLAKTLRRLADDGPDAFYLGPIAQQLLDEMQQGKGFITRADLAAYRAHERAPIHGTYRGYDIYGPPPPSSGGTVVVGVLNILEQFELSADRRAPETMHLILEATKRVYADRARHLGDPGFTKIPDHLTSKAHARTLAQSIRRDQATPSASLAPEIMIAQESESTTHFSVIDSDGMAVSNTYTLQNSYGSRVVVRGAGFLLNNEMTDFNWRPGVTDRSGRIGTPANQIAPGKRMLSSQSPTLVARDGKLVLVTGSPGGRTIPNTVLSVVLGVTQWGLDVRAAVDAPRWHHQWLPDVARIEGAERPEFAKAREQLIRWGHVIESSASQGDAHSIGIVDGLRIGAHDVRRFASKAAAE